MSDDKIIDFGQIKKQAEKTEAIDKFEALINQSIEDMMTGKVSYLDLMKKMDQFQKENNLSPEAFHEIEMGVLDRFGFSQDDINMAQKKMDEMKDDVVETLEKDIEPILSDYEFLEHKKENPSIKDFEEDLSLKDKSSVDESLDESEESKQEREMLTNARFNFFRKYSDMYTKKVMVYELKNDKNDLQVLFSTGRVTIISEKKIDFSDADLNTLILDYRMSYGKSVRVVVCEASNTYDYM